MLNYYVSKNLSLIPSKNTLILFFKILYFYCLNTTFNNMDISFYKNDPFDNCILLFLSYYNDS